MTTRGRFQNPILAGVGVLAILVGLLWLGQGLSLIPGSVMTGDSKWVVIGGILALIGVVLLFRGLNRSRSPRP